MIWNSVVWKDELQKELDGFSKILVEMDQYNGDPDYKYDEYYDSYYNLRLEKFLLVSSFVVRKLSDSLKLSDELESQDFNCYIYKRLENDDIISVINRNNVTRFYNLDAPEEVPLKLKEICNLFIHSLVFRPVVDDKMSLQGVFVNSDWTKDKSLYYVEINLFVKLVKEIINDEIGMFSHKRDKNGGEIIKKTRTKRLPDASFESIDRNM